MAILLTIVKLENHSYEIGAIYQLGEPDDSKDLLSPLSIFSNQIFTFCYLLFMHTNLLPQAFIKFTHPKY